MQNNKLAVALFLVLQIQDSLNARTPDIVPQCPPVCVWLPEDLPEPVAICQEKPDLTFAYIGECQKQG